MRILILGGAGFVGSNLARSFKPHYSNAEVVIFDNLRRRGSELNLASFKEMGIHFIHGDVRSPDDFLYLGKKIFDIVIDASAEPSVLAGLTQSPRYLIDTNLSGIINALEYCKNKCGTFVFLSTSRVYSIPDLLKISLTESAERFTLNPDPSQLFQVQGLSHDGITEDFPTNQFRSLYGTTKLSAELFVQEYADQYGLKTVINRCGVIAGPGQYGKTDQGVYTLWVANHFFKLGLKYTGFGGTGKQVRDLLHPNDLFRAILLQIENIKDCNKKPSTWGVATTAQCH